MVVVKVCFLSSNHPPEAFAGTEQVVVALARQLVAGGVEVAVVTSSDVVHRGVDVGDERFDGIVVRRLYKKLGEWDHDGMVRPRLLGLLREQLQQLRPDVVHVHSFAALGIGTLAVCRELGLPVVLSFHDLWVTCARYFRLPPPGFSCPVGTDRSGCVPCLDHALHRGPQVVAGLLAERDRLVAAEVALAAVCIAPSEAAARFVRDCLPYGGPIHVVPHGLLRDAPAAERRRAPLPGETLRVGTFGSLVAEKGVLELVAAVEGLPIELRLGGRFLDPTFGAAVRSRCAAQRTVLVETGPYGPQDRHPAADLHLAVFPSKCQETYGLVVDEALARGVPVVVSDRGAFAERATAPGVVVAGLSRLAAALHDLAASPDRLERLAAAVPRELPTIAHSARAHLDHYLRLANAR